MSSEDLRVDPVHGTRVHVVGARQGRPNLPSSGCPFCVGGVEAPDPYDVRWFSNRWPAMPDDRCEVILYTSDHDATFASLGVDGARRVVDLWAERTAELGGRDDVHYVLVFENRGPEIGATITHPHGQIYAFDHIPERQCSWLSAGKPPDLDPGDRLVASGDGWTVSVPVASPFPIALSIAPIDQVPDVVSLDADARTALASTLVDVFHRLDALYGQPLPYMMWLNQRPTDGGEWPTAWFDIEIVSPWRAAGVQRFIAAAEVATGEYFNPVVPEALAAQLRAIPHPPERHTVPGQT
jgi:UDPglucose--hexose-1-phosphate uridylyltransferase